MSQKYALIFVRPITVTDDILADSNVPEDDYQEWDPDVTYSTGERVIVLEDHGVWVSADDNNTGNDPLTSPTKWSREGPTNRWRVFDDSISTRTEQADSIQYELTPPRSIGGIGILNVVNATSAQVVMEHGSEVVYDETVSLAPMVAAPSWWSWFFGDRIVRTQSLFLDLPTYPGATITITINGGADLGVGLIALGQQRRFGYGVEYGARAGITTYSTVNRDIDGRASIRKRPYARRSSFNLRLPNAEIDPIYRFLGDIESEPVLMVASRSYEALSGYGLIKHFEVIIPQPTVSDCALEFDGMT